MCVFTYHKKNLSHNLRQDRFIKADKRSHKSYVNISTDYIHKYYIETGIAKRK